MGITKLREYLTRKGISYDAFGEKVGTTGTTVYRHITGRSRPRPELAAKYVEETNGELSYADIYGASPLKTEIIELHP